MGFWDPLLRRRKAKQAEAQDAPTILALSGPASAAAAGAAAPIAVFPDDATALPRIRREPAIQIAPDFKTVGDCQSVITVLDFGQFQLAAWMLEQMSWNSRLRAVLNTRLDGLIGTEIRWEPGRKNATAQRAARDIIEDWPLIATAATRKQLSRWGLMLGVGLAQKHWYESPTSGRQIPRLEVFHPQWAIWDWASRSYRVFTLDGWAAIPSPSLTIPGELLQATYGTQDLVPDSLRRWVIHEPFGQHSWREGLIHAAWRPWLAHEYANRDLMRASEKLGIGIVKVEYPKATDKTALNTLIGGIRTIGSEGVLPVEVYPEGADQKSYNVTPFEWSGTGSDIIRSAREAAAADLAVLILGHNTTAETKGASVGASAQVGNLIRGDIRVGDCWNEFGTMYLQVIRDWAEINYGDPGNAPVPVYVTDPPDSNQAAAQTLLNVTLAIDKLRAAAPGVDFDELATRFRIPLKPGGANVAPPAPDPVPGSAPPQTTPPNPASPPANGQGQ